MILNDAPQISIGFLKANGLLRFPYPNRLETHIAGINFVFHTEDRDQLEIIWSFEEEVHRCYIDMNYIFSDPGIHHYFLCPETGKRVQTIYLHQNRFASAAGHGVNTRAKQFRDVRKVQRTIDRLEGSNGVPRARGKRRAELLAFLMDLPDIVRGAPDVNLVISRELDAQTRRQRNRQRSTARNGDNSTQGAIERAESLEPWGHAHALEHAQSTKLKSAVLTQGVRQTTWKIVEEAPALDARALISTLQDQPIWGGFLVWPRKMMQGHDRFFAGVDRRDGQQPRLWIEGYPSDLGPKWTQIIELHRSPPRAPERWFQTCPIGGSRHDILYLRGRIFASRQVQRLRYASQS